MNNLLKPALIFLSLIVVNINIKAQVEYFLYPGVEKVNRVYNAPYISNPISINGIPDEPEWELAEWGTAQIYTSKSEDWGSIVPKLPEGEFQGVDDYKFQFKILWDSTTYYMLFKITDDVHIYSDHHAGYPGDAVIYPFGEENFGRTLWNKVDKPAVGKGTGFAFDAWRMDHFHFFLTWDNPEFKSNFARTVQGVMHNFYPTSYMTTRPDTAVIVANKYKATPAIYNPTAAYHLNEDNSVYIEFKDTIWSIILPGKKDFGPLGSDTLIFNFQINDADGLTNRRDYTMFLSTTDGPGSENTIDWTKLVLKHETTSLQKEESIEKFNFYPNPNYSEILHLNTKQDIVIYDLVGKEVLTSKNAEIIDISMLSHGIYIIKNSKGFSGKLIVN